MPPRRAPTSCRPRVAASQRKGSNPLPCGPSRRMSVWMRRWSPATSVASRICSRQLRSSGSICQTCPAADPDDIAGMLLPRYFAVWEDDHTLLGAVAGGGDEPDRSGHDQPDAGHACSADVANRHPGQSPAADRDDGCVRHRACDDQVRPRQSTNGRPQSRRTQRLGRPRSSGSCWSGLHRRSARARVPQEPRLPWRPFV